MKSRKIISILMTALILCSCSSSNNSPAEESSATVSATYEETESVSAETSADTTTESESESTASVTTTATENSTSATTTETTVSETTAVETTTSATTTTATETTVPETTTVSETTAASEETVPKAMEQYKEVIGMNHYFEEIGKKKTQPAIHIYTYNNEEIASKEVYNDSVIDVFNCDEKYRLTAAGGVRVRGNSSANDTVKPYRIKFYEKQNMLGLHDGKEYKSWVLLKSNWNLITDYMALNLAEEIFEGKYYSSDCTFVNLYINKEYKGLYVLCEQTQAAEGRVDVYEPKKGENQTDIGYLIELDNYAGEDPNEPCFFMDYGGIEYTDMLGETRIIAEDGYTIKSDTYSEAQRKFIEKYYNGIFKICYEGIENGKPMMFDKNYNVVSAQGVYSTPQKAIEAVVDVNSVANMLILEELVHNYDVGAGSFFMAVDFSKSSKYKKLTFMAPWDFNWAYNDSASGAYYASTFQKPVHDMVERSNIWLIMFMKADWFQDIVKEKWNDLQSDQSLNNVVYAVCDDLEALENDLGDETWRINSGADVAYFVDGRISWLESLWGKDAKK